RVVISNREVTFSRRQVFNTFEKITRVHTAANRGTRKSGTADPVREEVDRQCVQGGECKKLRIGARNIVAIGAKTVHVSNEFLTARYEHVTSTCQMHRIGTSIKKICTNP